ncbi:MAG: hypothetical protein AB1778_00910 [Candidatus Bipolaricaulota bacterium]
MKSDIRPSWLLGLVAMALAMVVPLAVRIALGPPGKEVVRVDANGESRRFTLAALGRLPGLTRQGEVQNQFGNWRDAGVYRGPFVRELVAGLPYDELLVEAQDGYAATISRERVEDDAYPMILATSCDGVSVPEWEDGPRIVVLPESGRVSNAEYGVVSAGSTWVKNVARIVPRRRGTEILDDEPPAESEP